MQHPTIKLDTTIISPTLYRNNAGLWTLSAQGNTNNHFHSIHEILGDKSPFFFEIFDELREKHFSSFQMRIESFTPPNLQVPQLLAIISYINNDFLKNFPLEKENIQYNLLYSDIDTFTYLNEQCELNDKNKRLKVAQKFLVCSL
jgi:hypothetical protein